MKGLKLQNLLSVKLSNVKHIFIIVIVSVGKCLADSCYMFTKSGKTFTENQNSCQDKGGDLVSMETEEEWTFINSQIQALNSCWRCECMADWFAKNRPELSVG